METREARPRLGVWRGFSRTDEKLLFRDLQGSLPIIIHLAWCSHSPQWPTRDATSSKSIPPSPCSEGVDSTHAGAQDLSHLPETWLAQSPAKENYRTLAPRASPHHALEPKGETKAGVSKPITPGRDLDVFVMSLPALGSSKHVSLGGDMRPASPKT